MPAFRGFSYPAQSPDPLWHLPRPASSLLRWLELRPGLQSFYGNLYYAIAILFTALGIWLAMKLTRPKEKTIVEG